MSMTLMKTNRTYPARFVPAALRGLARGMGLAFAAHWPLILLTGVFFLAETILTWKVPAPRSAPVTVLAAGRLMIIGPPVFLFILAIYSPLKIASYARSGVNGNMLKQLLGDIRKTFFNPARILNFLVFVIIITLFQKASLDFKANIPVVNPFSWDETFMHLDRWLHFGADPWRLLQPLMGYAPVTFAVNFAYYLWFFLLVGSWFLFATSARHSRLKMQFMSAFMLIWLIAGGVMALAFSSAGPVYYGRLGLSPDPYAPLMAYLHKINLHYPILALDTQDLLWNQYVHADKAFIGISAFPSMHNAVAALLALAAWKISRTAGVAMTVVAAMILAGSVHLGWHYAVDGYAGIAVAAACWLLAGRFAAWMDNRKETRRYRALLRALSR